MRVYYYALILFYRLIMTLHMKRILTVGVLLTLLISFSSCHSTEHAYKSVYDIVKEKQAQKDSIAISGAVKPKVVSQHVDISGEKDVPREGAKLVIGKKFLTYNVIVSTFKLRVTAEDLQERLEKEGYKDAGIILVEDNGPYYRVILSTFVDFQSALKSRNDFIAKYPNRKDFQGAWVDFCWKMQ